MNDIVHISRDVTVEPAKNEELGQTVHRFPEAHWRRVARIIFGIFFGGLIGFSFACLITWADSSTGTSSRPAENIRRVRKVRTPRAARNDADSPKPVISQSSRRRPRKTRVFAGPKDHLGTSRRSTRRKPRKLPDPNRKEFRPRGFETKPKPGSVVYFVDMKKHCGDLVLDEWERCDDGGICGDGNPCVVGRSSCNIGKCRAFTGNGCLKECSRRIEPIRSRERRRRDLRDWDQPAIGPSFREPRKPQQAMSPGRKHGSRGKIGRDLDQRPIGPSSPELQKSRQVETGLEKDHIPIFGVRG